MRSGVPLELPVRAGEAAALADLVFQVTERGPMSEASRHQLAARLNSVTFKSFTVRPWSLVADPSAPSTFYIAVDAEAPWLLHLAPERAPASGLFPNPTLIGRVRTPRGAEIVINAVPFSATDTDHIETFVRRLDRSLQARPQGSASLFVAAVSDADVAFAQYRMVHKKYGMNVAAFELADLPQIVWAAARHGWRDGYSVLGLTRVETGEIKGVREIRAVSNVLDVNWLLPGEGLTSAEDVRVSLRQLRDQGLSVQSVTVRLQAAETPETVAARVEWQFGGKPLAELKDRVRELQETARQFGALIRVAGSAEDSEAYLAALGAGAGGRLYYQMHPDQKVEKIAEIAGLLRG